VRGVNPGWVRTCIASRSSRPSPSTSASRWTRRCSGSRAARDAIKYYEAGMDGN
jgi:hypothetical protein